MHVGAESRASVGPMHAGHLQPEMSEHCDVVMPALVAALQSEQDSSIVERVAYGLDNSMEHLEEAALAQYLPAVMPPLLALLHAGDRRMHDTLLSCVSSAAAAGGDAFKPFAGARSDSCRAAGVRSTEHAILDCAGIVSMSGAVMQLCRCRRDGQAPMYSRSCCDHGRGSGPPISLGGCSICATHARHACSAGD